MAESAAVFYFEILPLTITVRSMYGRRRRHGFSE